MKFYKYQGFKVSGSGPILNDVQIQFSCGKENYQEITQTYGKRKKGYGKPKHSWKALARVFHYVSPDIFKVLAVFFVTIVMIFINLVGAFISAPLVDALLQPAVYSVTGNWLIGGNYLGYQQQVIQDQMFFYQYLFNTVNWAQGGIEAANEALNTLGIVISIMMVFYILAFLFSCLQVFLMTRIGTSSLFRLRNDMFAKLQSLPLRYFDNTSHGDIMSRFTNDVDAMAQFFNTGLMEVFTSTIMLIGILVFIFILNWLLAIVALVMESISVMIVIINVKRSVSAFSETQVSMGEFNGVAEEVLSGLKVVKCFSKEQDMSDLFKSIDYRHTMHNRRSVFLSSVNVPIVNNINNLTTGLVTIIGAILVATGFSSQYGFVVSIGSLISFITFLRMLSRPFNSISNMMTMIQSSLAGAERIFQMMDIEPELSLNKAKWRSYKAEDNNFYWTDGVTTKPVLGQVDMQHVYFSYEKGQEILKDITLYAHPGQKIALVGSTGAGKTTITNLLTRFYDIDSGQILIDGINIQDIDRVSMRRSMTLVLQDTHLFTGTIYDNIRYGHLKATDADCERAAKIACADEFIRKLPNGYNTVIDGANTSLSQGQKQLLSIARCATFNPPILILDEATSSVDTRTERLISHGMDNIMKGKTTFIIAHRLSTIRYCDCIMVMDHGKIIERGTHDQLLEEKGRYYDLWMGKVELD